jgi:hypothetical protein
MIAALLFWLAVTPRIELVNRTFDLPVNNWRYVPLPLNQQPAWVDCYFDSTTPSASVRAVLLSREDLDAWLAGHQPDELDATAAGPKGFMRSPVHEPDAYVAVENKGSRPATVHLQVFLDQPQVRVLSRTRQLAVILISFGVFFAIVSLSARSLLKAIKKPS